MRRMFPYVLVALALVALVLFARACAAAPVQGATAKIDGGQP